MFDKLCSGFPFAYSLIMITVVHISECTVWKQNLSLEWYYIALFVGVIIVCLQISFSTYSLN
jgi:hypothetical protein